MGNQPSRPAMERQDRGSIDVARFEKACSLDGEKGLPARLIHTPEGLSLETTQHWQADILKDPKNR